MSKTLIGSDEPDWELMFFDMCSFYISLFEGDTHMVDQAFDLMYKAGVVDKEGFEL